jgi:membrane protein required for colicin V production
VATLITFLRVCRFVRRAAQIASLTSLVASYFIALRFADRLAPMISDHAPFNKFIAMLIIYAVASAAIWMLFRVVAGFIDQVKLKEFDRQMGALVGFAKGVLLCIAVTFFAVTLAGQANRDRIIASRSGQYIVRVLDKADNVAPPEIKEVIGPYIDQINERLNPNYQPNPQQDLDGLRRMWDQQTQGGGTAAWPNLPLPQQPPAANPQTPATPISTGSNWR